MSKRNIGKEILQGLEEIKEWKADRKKLKVTEFKLSKGNDVAPIRNSLGLTQQMFAALMGVSVATLRNWEQGRREPQGGSKIFIINSRKSSKNISRSFS